MGVTGRLAAASAGAVVALATMSPSAVSGDIGVGISAQPIALGHPVTAGESYAMGPVTVVNTGTEPGTVSLRAGARPDQDAVAAPEAWVTFERDEIELDAGDRAAVAITLAVPDDAPDGDYRSLLYAGLTKPGAVGESGIGAEAATDLVFTVGQGAGNRSNDNVWLVGGAIAVLLVASIARKHSAARPRYAPRHLAANSQLRRK